MAELLGQPPARPLFTQLLLLRVSPALLPIPHPLPNQYGVRDWELAMSTDCKPTDLFYFLQPVLGSVIIPLGQGCTGDSYEKAKENPWHILSGISILVAAVPNIFNIPCQRDAAF